MSAVVGILNKQSVALAADSAVTIGGPGNRKIFNRANKLFALSKCQPIGIMLYNSATFMGTPWETLIKMYRRQLAECRFKTVRAYQDDFFNYLKSNAWFTDSATSQSFLHSFFDDVIRDIINMASQRNPAIFKQPAPDGQQVIAAVLQIVNDYVTQLGNNSSVCPDFKDYNIEDFLAECEKPFIEVLKARLGTLYGLLSEADIRQFMEAGRQILRMQEESSSFTGLIFAGFGDDEVFPNLTVCNVFFTVGNRLRYYEDVARAVAITHNNPGAVADFAQTDVIRTILTGVDPWLDQVHQHHFKQLLSKFRSDLVNTYGQQNQALKQSLEQIDLDILAKSYAEMNERLQHEKYIAPMLNAVNTLSKEDLAEMAESLIYLTYLKRRITFAEESVGGPVDVAVISKGDGLIWIKRKHYFAPELNQHFFKNYLKT